jgi:indolepyruvate ferredoxin oxidoreductase, beta subunit
MDSIRLVIVAVGGQGNLLASAVLGEAALLSGVEVKMSEIHGMAQRGGVVESAVVFGPARSTIISDGEADVLMGFEPSETLRALKKCSPDTVVITNLAPLPPFTVTIGRGKYPELETLQELIRKKCARLISFDAVALAKASGNVLGVNIVLLGALIRTGLIPIPPESLKAAIENRTKKAFLESNLKAFELGYGAADGIAAAG